MVPEAPIDGTMPSVFPEDRSGDFTFTRGSNLAATRVASNGLIEKGRENLLLQSNQFDTTPWNRNLVTATSGQSGYDGNTNAWKIELTGAAGNLAVGGLSAGNVGTYSVYAKAGTLNWILLGSQSGNIQAYINLSDGSIGTTGALVIEAKTEDVGGGWYRCSMTYSGTATVVRAYPAQANGNLTATSGNILIQDSQLEIGLAATEVISTGATTGKAGLLENEPRIDFTGGGCGSLLLEPQRTNLATNSEYTGAYLKSNITATSNQVVSPEGVENATEVETTSTGQCHMRTAFTTATGNYVGSVFIKKQDFNYIYMELGGAYAWFNINDGTKGNSGFYGSDWTYINHSIEDYGNGWYRCVLVGNCLTAGVYNFRSIQPVSGNGSYNSNLSGGLTYFYGAQVEAGSYPTSYIPTYGSSVTRSRDQANNISLNPLLGNGNISVMYDFVYDVVGREGSGQLFLLYSGNNSLGIKGTQPNDRRLQLFSYGDFTGTIGFNEEVPYQTRHKVVFRVTGEVVELFYNGVKQNATISGAALGGVYDWSRIKFDPTNAFLANLNQLAVFPTALTDEECSALTQP